MLTREEARELKSRDMKMMVLPMHGSLPAGHQMRVFQRTPRDTRKIVLATNIAEASITINGIAYGTYKCISVVGCAYCYMTYN